MITVETAMAYLAAGLSVLPAIKADIDAFVGSAPQFDDITMLCLTFKDYMPEEEK